mgnify:CR=1 FL=1
MAHSSLIGLSRFLLSGPVLFALSCVYEAGVGRAEIPPPERLDRPYAVQVLRLAPDEAFGRDRSCVQVGPYGKVIVAKVRAGNQVRIYRNDEPDPLSYSSVEYVEFSPTGHSAAYFGVVEGALCFIRNGVLVGEKPYLVDPDWQSFRLAWNPKDDSVATVTWDRGRNGLIRREGIPTRLDCDEAFEPTFSPDGTSFAFIGRSGRKRFVVRGGVRVSELYDDVRSLKFTPDSRSVMFVARAGDTSFVVKDGSRVSRRYKGSAIMVLSPSGRSYALTITEQDGNQYVVKNDRRLGPVFDEVSWPVFAHERDVLVFHARLLDRRFMVVKDGKRIGGAYDALAGYGPAISHDGSVIAFRGILRQGAFYRGLVIRDGQCLYEETYRVHETEPPLRGAQPSVSADGLSIAYDVEGGKGRRRVVRDGQYVGEEYDWVNNLTFSPDGRTLIFMAGSGGKSFYVCNGKRVCQEYTFVTPPVTSQDGAKVIFAGLSDNALYRNEIPW